MKRPDSNSKWETMQQMCGGVPVYIRPHPNNRCQQKPCGENPSTDSTLSNFTLIKATLDEMFKDNRKKP